MNVIKLWGGLGNQLFQFIFGEYIKLKTGKEIFYEVGWFKSQTDLDLYDYKYFELSKFNFNLPITDSVFFENLRNKVSISRKSFLLRSMVFDYRNFFLPVSENLFNRYPRTINLFPRKYFVGYWQDSKYLNSLNYDFIDFIKLKSKHKNIETNPLTQKILNSNSVSLQVRRGDYLNVEAVICDKKYYKRAIDFLNNKVGDIELFIFSDDIEWCKRNISVQENQFFIEPNISNPFADIYLMSLCKHNIIVNSTFGWWGAALNNNPTKMTISPKIWDHPLNLREMIKV